MWELLLEFDYQTVRHAVWAGYLFTFVFPLAAFYFLNKKQSLLNDKYQASVHTDKSKSPVQKGNILTGAVHSAFSHLSGTRIHQMIPMSQASFSLFKQ